MAPLKTIIKTCRDALIIVLVTLGVGELSLRIYNYFDPLPIFYSDSYNRFRGKPFSPDFSFHLNSKGFKDVEFSTHKEPGTTRILGVGDSFAFGVVPYEYNYLTLVEQQLKETGHNVEIINMGIPGIGPKEYLALLAREGFLLEPDKILLSFYVGNDFFDLLEESRSFASYSYVASLITYACSLTTKLEGHIIHSLPANAKYSDDAAAFTDEHYWRMQALERGIYLQNNQAFEDSFERAMTYISEIKQLCDRRNVGLTVIIIPAEMQISKPLQARLMSDARLALTSFDFAQPNRLLRARFEELKIDYIDLLPQFSIRPPNERLYKRNDIHWGIAGNALAATLISQHLSSELGAADR
jgi:SGNH hydrolase-like domain, acetyltransferase AlgX